MFIEILRRLHRGISLILGPLFLAIVISRALLRFALEPILGAGRSRPRAPMDTAALTRTLDRLDLARTARALDVDPDGAAAELQFEHGTAPVRTDIASVTVLAGAAEAISLTCG